MFNYLKWLCPLSQLQYIKKHVNVKCLHKDAPLPSSSQHPIRPFSVENPLNPKIISPPNEKIFTIYI